MKICLYLPFKYENTFNNAMFKWFWTIFSLGAPVAKPLLASFSTVKLVRTSKRHRWNNFTLCNTDQGCKKLYNTKKFRDLKGVFVLGGSIVHTSDDASASAEGEENMTRFHYRHLKRKRKGRRMQGNFAVSCVFVGACICYCCLINA